MKVLVYEPDVSQEYVDLDVSVVMDDNSEYSWRPYRCVEDGAFVIGDFRFAETTEASFHDCGMPPKSVFDALLPYARQVAHKLGVPTVRVVATLQHYYDRAL